MKNKIRRAKQFIHDHNDAYLWTCGLITGAGLVFIVMHRPHNTTEILNLTAEQAKAMMESDRATVVYELPKQTIALISRHN